jgi:hypothetical protein
MIPFRGLLDTVLCRCRTCRNEEEKYVAGGSSRRRVRQIDQLGLLCHRRLSGLTWRPYTAEEAKDPKIAVIGGRAERYRVS